MLYLTGLDAARVVTVRNNAPGNIRLNAAAGNLAMAPRTVLHLLKKGANWIEVSRSVNS